MKKLATRGQRALRFDVSPYQAQWQVQDAPSEVCAGQSFTIKAEVRNSGSALWLPMSESDFGVNVVYRWHSAEQVSDWQRLPLPQAVPPDKSIALSLTLQTPAQAGEYILELDLVREGVTWFAQTTGEGALRLPMRVTA